jgi:putative ABC transport system permease protein
MEFGPIIRSLFHNKTRFWLIALEIALTLAVVVNCVSMILDQRAMITRPTGYDEENLLVVTSLPFRPDFTEDDYVRAVFEEDMRILGALPGVRSATTTAAIPLSGGGSATGRRASGSEVDPPTVPYFEVSPGAVETFGVKLIEGRDFVESDWDFDDDAARAEERPITRNVIVSQAVVERLFPDGDALGKTIENRSGTSIETIVGIVERMHCSWPLSSVVESAMLYPDWPANSRRTRYMIRTEPGALDEVYRSAEEALLASNDGRIVRVESLAEFKADTYRELTAMNQLLGGVIFLLLAVTSLGIVGLTSFSVTQRTRQIGTRRALGATRWAILRYFLLENWIVTGIGLLLGVALSFGLNCALANFADAPRIGLGLVASGMVLLWSVGLIAALAPALRSTAVSPVTATRSV